MNYLLYISKCKVVKISLSKRMSIINHSKRVIFFFKQVKKVRFHFCGSPFLESGHLNDSLKEWKWLDFWVVFHKGQVVFFFLNV